LPFVGVPERTRCSIIAATASRTRRLVTIAKRPSREPGWAYSITISGKTKEEYFSREDWTGQISLKVLAKKRGWRRRFSPRVTPP
jgi:hypothetical protein